MSQLIIWNEEPGGNIEYIEAHGLTVGDVEHVLATFESEDQPVVRTPLCVWLHARWNIHYRGLRAD